MAKPNGRVDLLTLPDQFMMFDKPEQCTTYTDALTGNWTETPLSRAFFSKQNLQIIQNGVRAGVYNISKGHFVIANQSCDELKIIMRATFLRSSINLPDRIPDQIADINKAVIDYCVPRIYGEAKGYIQYLHDASTLVVPLSTPISTTANDKILELKPFF